MLSESNITQEQFKNSYSNMSLCSSEGVNTNMAKKAFSPGAREKKPLSEYSDAAKPSVTLEFTDRRGFFIFCMNVAGVVGLSQSHIGLDQRGEKGRPRGADSYMFVIIRRCAEADNATA